MVIGRMLAPVPVLPVLLCIVLIQASTDHHPTVAHTPPVTDSRAPAQPAWS